MTLDTLRNQIDKINRELVSLLAKRLEIAREIARIKKQKGLPVLDFERELAIKEEVKSLAKEHQLSPLIIEEIFQLILDYTRIEMEAVR